MSSLTQHARREIIAAAKAAATDQNERRPFEWRGDNIMLGYWRDPATTEDVLGSDGWLNTGDLGHYDAYGYFYIDGRANLLVKVQGYRVHPAEIEGVVVADAEQPREDEVADERADEAEHDRHRPRLRT